MSRAARSFVAALIFSASVLAQVPFRVDAEKLSRTDLEQILAQLCPGQSFIGKDGSGCKVCPQDTSSPGEKAGADITYALRGNLLSAKSDDVAVALYGCTAGAGGYFDQIVLTRTSGGWRLRGGDSHRGRCQKIRSSTGRDGLLCYKDRGKFGDVYAYISFGYVQGMTQELLYAQNDVETTCSAARRGSDEIAVLSSIDKVVLTHLKDGQSVLKINAVCSQGKLSAESKRACLEDSGSTLRLDQSPRVFELNYSFDGFQFSLDDRSQQIKRDFDACNSKAP